MSIQWLCVYSYFNDLERQLHTTCKMPIHCLYNTIELLHNNNSDLNHFPKAGATVTFSTFGPLEIMGNILI